MGLFDHLFKSKSPPSEENSAETGGKPAEPPKHSDPAPRGTPPQRADPSAFLHPKSFVPRGITPLTPPAKSGAISGVRKPAAPVAPPPVEEIVLTLGDVLSRIPSPYLKLGQHDPKRELRFNINDLSSDIARGRAAVPLSRIAQLVPDIFVKEITRDEDTEVRLPLQKLVEQIGMLRSRPAAGDKAPRPSLGSTPVALPLQDLKAQFPLPMLEPAAPGGQDPRDMSTAVDPVFELKPAEGSGMLYTANHEPTFELKPSAESVGFPFFIVPEAPVTTPPPDVATEKAAFPEQQTAEPVVAAVKEVAVPPSLVELPPIAKSTFEELLARFNLGGEVTPKTPAVPEARPAEVPAAISVSQPPQVADAPVAETRPPLVEPSHLAAEVILAPTTATAAPATAFAESVGPVNPSSTAAPVESAGLPSEPLSASVQPITSLAEPARPPGESVAVSFAEPVRTVLAPAATSFTEAVRPPAEPMALVTESAPPQSEKVQPVTEPPVPLVVAAAPVAEAVRPPAEPFTAVTAPDRPEVDPILPVLEPAQPPTETLAPSPILEPARPLGEPTALVAEAALPPSEPPAPVAEPVRPAKEIVIMVAPAQRRSPAFLTPPPAPVALPVESPVAPVESVAPAPPDRPPAESLAPAPAPALISAEPASAAGSRPPELVPAAELVVPPVEPFASGGAPHETAPEPAASTPVSVSVPGEAVAAGMASSSPDSALRDLAPAAAVVASQLPSAEPAISNLASGGPPVESASQEAAPSLPRAESIALVPAHVLPANATPVESSAQGAVSAGLPVPPAGLEPVFASTGGSSAEAALPSGQIPAPEARKFLSS